MVSPLLPPCCTARALQFPSLLHRPLLQTPFFLPLPTPTPNNTQSQGILNLVRFETDTDFLEKIKLGGWVCPDRNGKVEGHGGAPLLRGHRYRCPGIGVMSLLPSIPSPPALPFEFSTMVSTPPPSLLSFPDLPSALLPLCLLLQTHAYAVASPTSRHFASTSHRKIASRSLPLFPPHPLCQNVSVSTPPTSPQEKDGSVL